MRTLISLLCLVTVATTYAQSFSFTPDTLLEDHALLENYNTYQIDIVNETPSTLALSWRRLTQDQPDSWIAYICDNNICYDDIPINGDMFPFSPDETAFLKLGVNPYQETGTGVYQFLVFPTGDISAAQTATFIIHAGMPNSTQEPSIWTLNIGPNPFHDQMLINNPNGIEVSLYFYDASGQLISTKELAGSERLSIDASQWPVGSIFLSAFVEGKPLFSNQLIKY
jgi:hypothetical protein